jgi:anti-anti-sigma factor
MQAHLTKDGNKAVLKLSGRFDFNAHREFRAAVDPLVADPGVNALTIEFSAVEYLDSSALCILLMLREKTGGARKEITLAGVHGNVKQVLDIANFAKLFQITRNPLVLNAYERERGWSVVMLACSSDGGAASFRKGWRQAIIPPRFRLPP